jgi:hypothetical protein
MATRSGWADRLERHVDGLEGNDRLVEVAAGIQAALAERGIELVAVGGVAVAAFDPDARVTADIDFVGPALSLQIDDALQPLGFRRSGRHWFHEILRVAVEVPDGRLAPDGAEAGLLRTRSGSHLRVITVEDLILDRTEQWAATGALDAWLQAARLLEVGGVDRRRLAQRAAETGHEDGLAVVAGLAAEARAGRSIDSPASRAAQRSLQLHGDPARALAAARELPAPE